MTLTAIDMFRYEYETPTLSPTVGDYDLGVLEETVSLGEVIPLFPESANRATEAQASAVLSDSTALPPNDAFGRKMLLGGLALVAFLAIARSILPNHPPEAAPNLRNMVNSLRRSTGWSDRALANLTGSTHPTIRSLSQGRPGAGSRSPELVARLTALYSLTIRILPLVGGDATRLELTLQSQSGATGSAAADLLREGRFAEAYLAALDAIEPPHQVGEMLTSTFQRRPGEAATALTD